MLYLSRREKLDMIQARHSQHAGLWLDRFLSQQIEEGHKLKDKEPHPYTTLIGEAHAVKEPIEYIDIFTRWKLMLSREHLSHYQSVLYREAHVRGRMVVGLGNESTFENAITIHHTYGVPYIPGSALKGLAAAYAHRFLADATWRKEIRNEKGEIISKIGDAHKIMFGDTTSAGYLTFFDALYVSGSGFKDQDGNPHALWPDVITVHHPDYYQEKKQGEKPDEKLAPPADWDSPTPISFISATGTYLIALAGPEAWVTAAFDILALALDEIGVGGKTSSGYGRLTLDGLDAARERWSGKTVKADSETSKDIPQTDLEQQLIAPLLDQIQTLPPSRVATEINRFYQQWKSITVREELRQQIAMAIIEKVREAKREEKSSSKAWYQEMLTSITKSDQS